MPRSLGLALALLAAPAFAQQPDPPPVPVSPVESPILTPAPTPAPAPLPPPVPAPAAAPAEPLAGYNGSFFLRDPNDWFVLFPKGRMQIDWYNYLNRGDEPASGANSTDDKRLKSTLFVRRARAELQGTIAHHFDFHLGGEFATTPATGSYGTLTDVYVIVDYMPWAKLQVGQFDTPFTLENRTSDKFFDFMERAIAIRSFAVPANKDTGAMVWGYFPNKLVYYSVGVFNGDGQQFKNQDNQPAVIGRGFVAPLAPFAKDRKWMNDLWVGGSFWWQKAVNLGGFVAPSTSAGTQNDLAGMSTQGGFGFFSSSYGNGMGVRSHLVPDGEIVKWALEANLPVSRVGLRFELVHQDMSLAQYNDTAAVTKRSAPTAFGKLSGTGWYVELFGWILGDVNFIETPGLELAPHLKKFAPAKEPTWGLMVAAKVEHVDFDVSGLPTADPALGHYAIDAVELGVNAWATKHLRISANYVVNFVGGFGGGAAATDAKNLQGNLYYGKMEHELLLRIGVNL